MTRCAATGCVRTDGEASENEEENKSTLILVSRAVSQRGAPRRIVLFESRDEGAIEVVVLTAGYEQAAVGRLHATETLYVAGIGSLYRTVAPCIQGPSEWCGVLPSLQHLSRVKELLAPWNRPSSGRFG